MIYFALAKHIEEFNSNDLIIISLLPVDSGADAVTFERDAWRLGRDGFFNLIKNFTGPSPHFISWLIGIPYSLFSKYINGSIYKLVIWNGVYLFKVVSCNGNLG